MHRPSITLRSRYKLRLIALGVLVTLFYFWKSDAAANFSGALPDTPVVQSSKPVTTLTDENISGLLAGFPTGKIDHSADLETPGGLVQTGQSSDHKSEKLGIDSKTANTNNVVANDATTRDKSGTLITDSQEKADPDSLAVSEAASQAEPNTAPSTDQTEAKEAKVDAANQGSVAEGAEGEKSAVEEKPPELTAQEQKEKDELEHKRLEKEKEDQVRERRHKIDIARREKKEKVAQRLEQPEENDYRQQLDVADDQIGVIIRTGYDVQHRLEGPLSTFLKGRENHTFLASDMDSTWDGHVLHDSIGRLSSRPSISGSEKYKLYEKLKARVGEVKTAEEKYDYNNKETEGWKLDGLKFVSSIEMGYAHLGGNYKWYLILDDDTYVHYPSLKSILSKLEYRDNHFLGMGGWIMGGLAYAHGGAGIVVSQAAMKSRFVDHAASLESIHDRSVVTAFGDFLFSIAMDEIDILVDNTWRISFHEHEPARERISRDDVCKPAVTYHHLAISVMKQIEAKFSNSPFSHIDMRQFLLQDSDLHKRESWSYNLERDDNKEDPKVRSDLTRINMDERHKYWMTAEKCEQMCLDMTEDCVAWTYIDEGEKSCVLSDFFRMGYERPGMSSGVNKDMLNKWLLSCHGF